MHNGRDIGKVFITDFLGTNLANVSMDRAAAVEIPLKLGNPTIQCRSLPVGTIDGCNGIL
jgi:hypothetical protein